jgi:hypothetical protein
VAVAHGGRLGGGALAGRRSGGVAVGIWLALAAPLAVIAWLLAPLEPVLQLAPPFLAAAPLWPAVAGGRDRPARSPLVGAAGMAGDGRPAGCLAHHIFEPMLLKAEKPIDSADHQMLLFRVR